MAADNEHQPDSSTSITCVPTSTAPRPSLEDRFKDQPELESQQQGLLNLLKGSSPAAPSTDRPALNVTNHATDGFESVFQINNDRFSVAQRLNFSPTFPSRDIMPIFGFFDKESLDLTAKASSAEELTPLVKSNNTPETVAQPADRVLASGGTEPELIGRRTKEDTASSATESNNPTETMAQPPGVASTEHAAEHSSPAEMKSSTGANNVDAAMDIEAAVAEYLRTHELPQGPHHLQLYLASFSGKPLPPNTPEHIESLTIMQMIHHPTVRANFNAHKINHLYIIQVDTIKTVETGIDTVVNSIYGTGKTAMYLVPILDSIALENDRVSQALTHNYNKPFLGYVSHKASRDPSGRSYMETISPRCVILAPDNELAQDVFNTTSFLANGTKVTPRVICGRFTLAASLADAHGPCDVLVATPGRLATLATRGKLNFSRLKWLVMDEFQSYYTSNQQLLQLRRIFFQNPSFNLDRHGAGVQRILVDGSPDETWLANTPEWLRKDQAGNTLNMKHLKLVQFGLETREFYFVQVEPEFDLLDAAVAYTQHRIPDKLIVYVSSKGEANSLYEKFHERLIDRHIEVLHSDISHGEREEISNIAHSEPKVIVIVCLLLSKGVNLPELKDVMFAGCPSQDNKFLQASFRVGRKGNDGRVHVLFHRRSTEEELRYNTAVIYARSRAANIEYFSFPPLTACPKGFPSAAFVQENARQAQDSVRQNSGAAKPKRSNHVGTTRSGDRSDSLGESSQSNHPARAWHYTQLSSSNPRRPFPEMHSDWNRFQDRAMVTGHQQSKPSFVTGQRIAGPMSPFAENGHPSARGFPIRGDAAVMFEGGEAPLPSQWHQNAFSQSARPPTHATAFPQCVAQPQTMDPQGSQRVTMPTGQYEQHTSNRTSRPPNFGVPSLTGLTSPPSHGISTPTMVRHTYGPAVPGFVVPSHGVPPQSKAPQANPCEYRHDTQSDWYPLKTRVGNQWVARGVMNRVTGEKRFQSF